MIKPTVGRVVLFVPRVSDYSWGYCLSAGKQHAAVVAEVHSDRLVNLSVLDRNGKQFGRTSVVLRQAEDEIPGGDYCEWMPYQLGQAAKTEAALAAAPK